MRLLCSASEQVYQSPPGAMSRPVFGAWPGIAIPARSPVRFGGRVDLTIAKLAFPALECVGFAAKTLVSVSVRWKQPCVDLMVQGVSEGVAFLQSSRSVEARERAIEVVASRRETSRCASLCRFPMPGMERPPSTALGGLWLQSQGLESPWEIEGRYLEDQLHPAPWMSRSRVRAFQALEPATRSMRFPEPKGHRPSVAPFGLDPRCDRWEESTPSVSFAPRSRGPRSVAQAGTWELGLETASSLRRQAVDSARD